VNLADLLAATAARHPERLAVTEVLSGGTLTYAQLSTESARVGAFLRAQGVERNQRIGLRAPNGLGYLPAAFGLLATGACLVPVPDNLTSSETASLLGDVEVNGCFRSPSSDTPQEGGHGTRLTAGPCDGFTFEWVNRALTGPAALSTLNPAFIRFTSGTTAHSKGVVLSHEATLPRVDAAGHVLRFTENDRILWVLPLAYHFAVTIVAYVRAGCHVLLCQDAHPDSVFEAIQRQRATVFYASPLHFERLANVRRSERLGSLRLALSTSAPITSAVMERFHSAHDVPIAQAYGIIEAGLPCINLPADALAPTSVGRPIPGYEVAVLEESGEPMRPGGTGEVGVRGAGLFSAYYSPWQLREEISRDGWFLTGDMGHFDESGALHLVGRKKAVIFVGGLKFFPEEVETCINAFPGVLESRVHGSPGDVGPDEVPHAEVVVAASGCDLAALKEHCSRNLSPHKVPVGFTVVPAIAKTPGGKILRRAAPTDGPLTANRA
jgi:long-chain acyl-CoA synthetase